MMVNTSIFHRRYCGAKSIADIKDLLFFDPSPKQKPNSPTAKYHLPTKNKANETGKHAGTAIKYMLKRDKEKILPPVP
jgi:hypothetical protein